jgi:NADH-ubiquinone oxidoreductase chain 5
MIILVTADNFLLMFVGWEGVGVCSYLLVNFWYTRIAANQSSISAFLTNRVGDCLLTIGMFVIMWTVGTIDYNTIFSVTPYVNKDAITLIGICLLIGAMAKSSQIGLHVWLPMAMEGPTPVSALIHAATMVTAGVYLLMRCSPILEYSSTILILCLWIGAITTLFSSLIGLLQQDIKKVIAYSTMSQLGMMVIAVGLSYYNLALFHLVNHAFYKGLLFLGAGSVIHAVSDNQDFRKFGALRQFLPFTYSVMLIASLSLVAFPYMTGFYSKDFILESAYGKYEISSITVYFIATIAAIFTTLYSVKVLYFTFLSNPFSSSNSYKNAHEPNIYMSIPLFVLAIFSIFFGYITKDLFIGLGSDFFIDNSIYIHPNREITINTEFAVQSFYKLLPFFFTISMIVLSTFIFEYFSKSLLGYILSRLGYNIFGFLNQRFLVELYYNNYVTGSALSLGGVTSKVLDKGSVELIGPYGLEKELKGISKSLSSLDTGLVTTYALYILTGVIVYMLVPYIDYSSQVLLILSIFIYINTNAVLDKSNLQDLIKVSSRLSNTTLKSNILLSLGQAIIVLVPMLLSVAYTTVAERKTMASMQRRLGPNRVGYLGMLQAFADALKLLLKEYVAPTQSNIILFFIGPFITLIFSLLIFMLVPYGPGIAVLNMNLGILAMLAISSLSTYGILLAGWSANSKYAFLGSLRSTAQLISYELILSSAILVIVLLTGSLNITANNEVQKIIWFIIPLFPVFIVFYIGSVAETNRAPFDLAEAESELVSGFMTEHSAVIFVFFFLAEYSSILFMCIISSILLLGGYLYLDMDYILFNILSFNSLPLEVYSDYAGMTSFTNELSNYKFIKEGLFNGLSLGVKSCLMVFVFIWVRASFPRIRYDQLMSFCWTILLPIVVAFIVIVPCLLYGIQSIPSFVSIL